MVDSVYGYFSVPAFNSPACSFEGGSGGSSVDLLISVF